MSNPFNEDFSFKEFTSNGERFKMVVTMRYYFEGTGLDFTGRYLVLLIGEYTGTKYLNFFGDSQGAFHVEHDADFLDTKNEEDEGIQNLPLPQRLLDMYEEINKILHELYSIKKIQL